MLHQLGILLFYYFIKQLYLDNIISNNWYTLALIRLFPLYPSSFHYC